MPDDTNSSNTNSQEVAAVEIRGAVVASGPETIFYGAEWVVLAMASGITGNLAYDAIKAFFRRFVRVDNVDQPVMLKRDDALQLARIAVRIYCQERNIAVDVDAAALRGPLIPTPSGGWDLTLTIDKFAFYITIPSRGAILGRVRVTATSYESSRFNPSEFQIREKIGVLRERLNKRRQIGVGRENLDDRLSFASALMEVGEFRAAAAEYEECLAEAEALRAQTSDLQQFERDSWQLKYVPSYIDSCQRLAALIDQARDYPAVNTAELAKSINEIEQSLAERRSWKLEAEAKGSSMASLHRAVECDLLVQLADSYRILGSHQKAIPLYEDLLSMNQISSVNAYILTIRYELADCYLSTSRLGDAGQIYASIMEPCRQILGPDHPITLKVRDKLKLL